VGHDTVRGGHDELSELTGREQTDDPLLDITDAAVKARGDNTALVQSANEVYHNLATTVIVYDLEISNVSVLLHGLQKLDNNFGRRADHNLPLSSLFCVVDVFQRVMQYGHTNHLGLKVVGNWGW
jgi:hypothetical protein